MRKEFSPGSRVILLSFNGTTIRQPDVDACDNYWLLIGKEGVIVANDPPRGIEEDRLLIQFSVDVGSMGLACHNEIANSLWLKRSDLALLA